MATKVVVKSGVNVIEFIGWPFPSWELPVDHLIIEVPVAVEANPQVGGHVTHSNGVATVYVPPPNDAGALKVAARVLHARFGEWFDDLNKYRGGFPLERVNAVHETLAYARQGSYLVLSNNQTGVDGTTLEEWTQIQRTTWAQNTVQGPIDAGTVLAMLQNKDLAAPTHPIEWAHAGTGSRTTVADIARVYGTVPTTLDLVGGDWIEAIS